jgi:hypothetical protein
MRSDRSFCAHKSRWLVTLGALAIVAALPGSVSAAPQQLAGTYTATTANMTPAGLDLRMQIIQWQEADARAEVVATLAAGADAATPLGKLPTVGYVWPKGSPVGYSLKYAHRAPQPDGSERITLVTDRRLGSYDFKGWSVANGAAPSAAAPSDVPYSVIELVIDGSGAGTGTFSLAGAALLDEAAGTVALNADSPSLLTNVQRVNAAH